MEPREVIAFPTIKKTLLPEINVKETEERTAREMLRELL